MKKQLVAIASLVLVVGCGATTTTEDSSGGGGGKNSTSQKKEVKMTPSQENAVKSAQNYVDFGAFSKLGLIKQLSSQYGEGFPKKDAVFAVNNIDVNWKQEAVESAKSYLETQPFSRDGLLDQLTSSYGEQFTKAEAEYAVNKAGL